MHRVRYFPSFRRLRVDPLAVLLRRRGREGYLWGLGLGEAGAGGDQVPEEGLVEGSVVVGALLGGGGRERGVEHGGHGCGVVGGGAVELGARGGDVDCAAGFGGPFIEDRLSVGKALVFEDGETGPEGGCGR